MSGQPRPEGPALPRQGVLWPLGPDPVVAAMLAVGAIVMYLPMAWDWAQGTWAIETQGHELLVMAISAWLVYRKRVELGQLASRPASLAGGSLFVLALLSYLIGRAQGVFRLELLSVILMSAALLLFFKGFAGLRRTWFALFFLLFAIPLPFSIVLTVTGPMKTAVSAWAAQLLQWTGYPIGRSACSIHV